MDQLGLLTEQIRDKSSKPDAPAGDSTVFQLLSHTSGVASETDSSVVRTLLRQAETAAILYADPARNELGGPVKQLADSAIGAAASRHP